MNAKQIGLIITFTAIAIILNAIKIPAFFWPGNFFTLSDIPVVVAFILFGVRIGVTVGFFNLLGQLMFFMINPAYLAAYPMGFVATLLMLLGIYIACKFIERKKQLEPFGARKTGLYLTLFPFIFRGTIMPLVDYQIFYHLLLPMFGYSLPEAYIMGLIPVFLLFNAIVPLYTVPLAYTITIQVKKALKLQAVLLT
jgi:hypothetical protein